jgi:hypothetical protein
MHIPGVPESYFRPEVEGEDYLMKNDIDFHNKPNLQKFNVVSQKLYEIILLLNPLEYGFSEDHNLEPEILDKIYTQLEKEFADEITALYYFHLCFEFQFDTRIDSPSKYISSTKLDNQLPIFPIPKSCLYSILQKDDESPSIKEWYYKWMNDICSLQKEIYETSKSMTQQNVKYLSRQVMY